MYDSIVIFKDLDEYSYSNDSVNNGTAILQVLYRYFEVVIIGLLVSILVFT